MAEESGILSRKTLRSSYISSIISISLVLFLLGILGVLLLQANSAANFVKENFQVSLILKNDVSESTADSLEKVLRQNPMVHSSRVITKEEAAKKLEADLGEDFVSFLGYNPLNASIDVTFKAAYVNDSLYARVQQLSSQLGYFKEVYYQKLLVEKIHANLRTISLVILGFSALLLFVAVILINNTIRISLYARRMLIRSMQLVGATRNFIRKPFLLRAMLHGLYSAIIAGMLVAGLVYLIKTNFSDLNLIVLNDMRMWLTLLGGLILTGVFISLISTYFAVNKWLGKRAHELF